MKLNGASGSSKKCNWTIMNSITTFLWCHCDCRGFMASTVCRPDIPILLKIVYMLTLTPRKYLKHWKMYAYHIPGNTSSCICKCDRKNELVLQRSGRSLLTSSVLSTSASLNWLTCWITARILWLLTYHVLKTWDMKWYTVCSCMNSAWSIFIIVDIVMKCKEK